MANKDYLINSLEKKIVDFDTYYKNNKEKEERFIFETSNLLIGLKNEKLEDSEKTLISKAVEIIKKVRRGLR